ncbi:MAG: type I DNA topoisomerase [Deltaproteobacteria bacterium]|nr:type I DNA topoisomerase [Deltaproteobacteria bacterium]
MNKGLIVVESPAKIKTLKKYLGANYEIAASVGHIKDLPKSKLGIDIENGFAATYQITEAKKKVVAELKKIAKPLNDIYIATDPDREGEAIAWHIAEEIGAKGKNIQRVLFNDLTKQTVLNSLANPTKLNSYQYEAQQTRRLLDRLVGYKISPLLWSKVRYGLSAGRVQSVAVRIICEREEEIRKFVPVEYWNISADLQAKTPPSFTAKLHKIAGKKAKVEREEQAKEIVARIEKSCPFVVSVVQKETKKNPPPPFTTSKLQQEAAKSLYFSAKKTMMIAQKLYEGIELGKQGATALITYMRTDSTRVADSALEELRGYIRQNHGKDYLPEKPRGFEASAAAQDAHEAIRPVSLEYTPESVSRYLSQDELRLYQLIWNRFVASQMNPAVYDQTTLDVMADDCLLRASGSILKFAGFTIVYTEAKEENEEDDFRLPLPKVTAKETLKILGTKSEQKFTQPAPRFSEASLVRELEENGIGRPSTYASILSTIQEREYVKIEQGKFHPTDLGEVVNKLLVGSFARVMDVKFTAIMEEKLDAIAEGKAERLRTLEDFYQLFASELKEAGKKMTDLKGEGEATEIVCEKCGAPMVIKMGRNGQFLACAGYPQCKNTKNFRRAEGEGALLVEDQVPTDKKCEKCGKAMVMKSGRFGKFFACSGYPECKTTMPLEDSPAESSTPAPPCPKCGEVMSLKRGQFGKFWGCSNYPQCKTILPLSTGAPCPLDNCDGFLTERKSKRGRVFYSCSNYPQCTFATWNKPTGKQCPICGKNSMAEKYTARSGAVSSLCLNDNCPSAVETAVKKPTTKATKTPATRTAGVAKTRATKQETPANKKGKTSPSKTIKK